MLYSNREEARKILDKMEILSDKINTLKLPEITISISDNYRTVEGISIKYPEHTFYGFASAFLEDVIQHYQDEFEVLNSKLETL
jgi:hypothetical protein